jgi:hypothetical protein
MLDPTVSLAMLSLDTQLALAGSADRKVVSVRDMIDLAAIRLMLNRIVPV